MKSQQSLAMCGRQSAKSILEDRIMRLRRKADQLQEIKDMLPEQLTMEQDEAIWQLICDHPSLR